MTGSRDGTFNSGRGADSPSAPQDTGLGQKGAWDRKVIQIGTDVSMWQQQGQETEGEQARPHQGSSERLGHLGSLRRKSSEHRGALDFP